MQMCTRHEIREGGEVKLPPRLMLMYNIGYDFIYTIFLRRSLCIDAEKS